MTNGSLIIIGVAVVLLLTLLFVLARSGRKPIAGPPTDEATRVDRSTDIAAGPLPEPGAQPSAAFGLGTAELAEPGEPAPAPVEEGPPDPLTRMKGLGPKAEARLNELGVTRYAQIAAWTPAQAERIDAQMGAFKGRIARDRWIEQARLLAADDIATYEQTFGKLG